MYGHRCCIQYRVLDSKTRVFAIPILHRYRIKKLRYRRKQIDIEKLYGIWRVFANPIMKFFSDIRCVIVVHYRDIKISKRKTFDVVHDICALLRYKDSNVLSISYTICHNRCVACCCCCWQHAVALPRYGQPAGRQSRFQVIEM
jgi:hypothetical protein